MDQHERTTRGKLTSVVNDKESTTKRLDSLELNLACLIRRFQQLCDELENRTVQHTQKTETLQCVMELIEERVKQLEGKTDDLTDFERALIEHVVTLPEPAAPLSVE